MWNLAKEENSSAKGIKSAIEFQQRPLSCDSGLFFIKLGRINYFFRGRVSRKSGNSFLNKRHKMKKGSPMKIRIENH